MKYIKYLLVVGLMTFFTNADAQYYEEAVYLTNGSIIKGDVIEQNKEIIKIEIVGGSILVYRMSEVDKIVKQEKVLKFKKRDRSFQIKESGYFHNISAGFLTGQGQFNDLNTAGSFRYTFGYQYEPKIGVGIGVGSDTYFDNDARTMIPIYLNGRGYLLNKPFSPYYSVDVGYGFAVLGSSWNIVDAQGGVYLHPKIGFRFPSRSNAAFTMELGYSYQKGKFTYEDWQGRYTDNISFRRVSILFGISF